MAEYRTMSEPELRERTRALLAEIHPERTTASRSAARSSSTGSPGCTSRKATAGSACRPKMNIVVHDEIAKHSKVVHGDPPASLIGIGMGAPIVLTYASEEQKKHLLPTIFSGEEIWCQMFSEPSAGSDVAGLATRAVRDGDDWIVNGQKVWTTVAHLSNWGMLLARTNPDVPKHDGLSYFILDMQAPGVEVRPLYQITGEAEFNEVFFDNVRHPAREHARQGRPGLARRDHDAHERARRDRRRRLEAQGRRRRPRCSKLWKDRQPRRALARRRRPCCATA